jgi:hypothetical protein
MYGWGGGLLSGGMQNMQMPQNPNRNWGANQSRNQWVANVTGYTGDFGGGQFGQWGQQNGWDANTLSNMYDQMNQQPQQPTMQGGWGSMPALQGLLSGYQPMGSYGGYGGASFGAPVNPQMQPGFAGTFPPANSGSNMLWTV